MGGENQNAQRSDSATIFQSRNTINLTGITKWLSIRSTSCSWLWALSFWSVQRFQLTWNKSK